MNFHTISRAMKLTTFAAILSLPLAALHAETAKEKVQKKTEHAHLVGHEDALLLKRIEDAIAEWDPRNLTSPYLKEINTKDGKKYALRRPDLAEFIADPDASVALGKALFWDMQAGSDFRKDGQKYVGTACASCHYRFGADARDRNTDTIAFQAWTKFVADRGIPAPTPDFRAERSNFAQRNLPAPFNETIAPWKFGVNTVVPPPPPGLLQHEIVGSQGIVLKRFTGLVNGVETSADIPVTAGNASRPDMFFSGATRTRQVTQRNSPSIINAVFNDRQFHDGRAESTFNGFSVFGDFDKRVVLKKAFIGADGGVTRIESVPVAIVNASLASQAVGPIVNEVEMSYQGRTFHDIAAKLLGAKPLAAQITAPNDSVLGGLKEDTYRKLIQRAFRREWWDAGALTGIPLFDWIKRLPVVTSPEYAYLNEWAGELGRPANLVTPYAEDDALMVNNFSLYWGLAIMLYESTLISNETPFDQMMRGDPSGVDAVFAGRRGPTMTDLVSQGPGNTAIPAEPPTDDTIRRAQLDKFITKNAPPVLTGTAMFQRGFRVFVQNCAECHEPPFFTSAANLDLGPEVPDPIAKLHGHSLIRTALADAFKSRLVTEGQPRGTGVTDANRHLLGNRNFFFDQERIPEVEASVGELMIELMGIPDERPLSFNVGALPGQLPPDRNPMITWADWVNGGGTRPPLGFEPSQQPGEDPVEPYAFYDVGFYNIGVSEPRYDWGVWAFDGADEALTTDVVVKALTDALNGIPFSSEKVGGEWKLNPNAVKRLAEFKINPAGVNAVIDRLSGQGEKVSAVVSDGAGIPSLGSAYRLARPRRAAPVQAPAQGLAQAGAKLLNRVVRAVQLASQPVDHSNERGYLDLDEGRDPGKRADHHFFKRARRMVMSEETWGHRKPFVSDSELMGWGAFKAPSLRNVALTEPYMHNGRFLTLRQVLQFYSFDNTRLVPAHTDLNPDLHPEMGRLAFNSDGLVNNVNGVPGGPLNLTQIQDAESLLFFLHCLTDERVRLEKAPFDHPSIVIPNGYSNTNPITEITIPIGAIGAGGQTASPAQFPAAN